MTELETAASGLYADYDQWKRNLLAAERAARLDPPEDEVWTLTWKALPEEQKRQFRWMARLLTNLGIRRAENDEDVPEGALAVNAAALSTGDTATAPPTAPGL